MLLADLGITKTHSRPHVSNDNPYSEAQCMTLKYRPDFPERFVLGTPHPPALPTAAWINKPKSENESVLSQASSESWRW